jgi:predicted component of type VI protein secretion system
MPDVDLTPFGAIERGVSRRHLRIRCPDYLLYVTDLGSRNGTWLNGHIILPGAERLLRSGDTLQLGALRIRVKFWQSAPLADRRSDSAATLFS